MCFSNATKRCSSRYLYFVSFLLFVTSVSMILISLDTFKKVDSKVDSGNLHTELHIDANEYAKRAMKMGGIVGLWLAAFGFLTACNRVPYFACPFAVGTFLLGTLSLIVFIGTVSPESAMFYKQQTCNALTENGNQMQTGSHIAKTMNVNFIDKLMCSKTCPCEPESKMAWMEAYNEQQLKDRGRTWGTKETVPMNGHFSNTIFPMNFDGGRKSYSSFESCYNE